MNPFARDYSNAGTDIAVPSVDSVTGSDSGGSLGIVVLLSLLGLAVRRTLTLV
ncbi:GlyGly-CTERM sorting domain-containing protein [Photobacterium sanguinicancri]|uniref:GlyGly-CTERM sorting domain-containing protein n=1 Tax=Photobacterium sanguinicancri TaxID=875932 RepID=UPI000AECB319|nr:GlyGly-CTERM sorting domain-containing protein [Photobacterium sanguinicancri]